MRFLIPFIILALAQTIVTATHACTIKQYIHRGTPAMESYCEFDPNETFPCYEDPHQYAITWISFLKPSSTWKLDLSPINCAKQAEILHNLAIKKADNLHWGHETKFKSLFLKGKLKYRNPNYIEANL